MNTNNLDDTLIHNTFRFPSRMIKTLEEMAHVEKKTKSELVRCAVDVLTQHWQEGGREAAINQMVKRLSDHQNTIAV